ncbi:YfaZ family outer membrane protein [Sulfuricurvum sp.]|uniref:YfaZ family outer membrane protein n=1 Tax=Sulfuricurvum sp. TaxID=2025608 RepID=UPI0019AFE1C8|nr:YfaZ family outer membrane protein [Sulfuricurvum sp.]MBD3806211.1 hypothetical protein [Sulfuricurvum sp.]
MLKKIIVALLMGTSLFAVHQVGVNVNDKEVGGEIRLDMGRMGNAMSNAYIGARFLNGDNNNSKTITNPDPLMEVSFVSMGDVNGVSRLKVGLGIKAAYTEIDGSRYAAIPLGVEGELRLPLNTPFPLYLNGALYYAPSVLSFKEGDGYMQRHIGIDAKLIDNARIGVGYRTIDTDLKSRDVVYNDAWYFGMRLDF